MTGTMLSDSPLKRPSSEKWLTAVLADFDTFLLDHAANERKASTMAMSLVAHYPDKKKLVEAMIDLALEELNHFRQVVRLINRRDMVLAPDEKDAYVNQLRNHFRKGAEKYFLDRLLCAAVIEARGAERFNLIAGALQEPDLKAFYTSLSKSESNHYELFTNLAAVYFPKPTVQQRFHEWLTIEDRIMDSLDIKPRLH
ncbi:MAG: tRNA-(ms[2]io[6]A)-hydroxylase [Pseudomonadales bacterium]